MMKLLSILMLLVLPLSGEEDPKPQGRKELLAKVRVAQTDYQVRNIGKGDPRFTTLQKEIAVKGPTLTPDELYSRLLAGKTFRIERAQPAVACKECNGFGRVPDKGTGYRRGDGKVPCAICHGEGKVIPIQPLVVRW